MPLLRKPELLPVKGANFAVPSSYLPEGYAFPQNMQYFRGEMTRRDGRAVLGGSTIGGHKVLHMGTQIVSTGVLRLFRMTKLNIQKYNIFTSVWDDVTGTDLTGTEADFFSDCEVTEFDLYLFTNRGIDVIRKYDGSGNTAILGGSPPKAKYLAYVTPYVLAANLVDGGQTLPTKVKWCDTGQPEVWTGGNSGSALLSDEPSHIRQMKKLREYAMVYKEKSVYRGRKVTTSSIFDFQLMSSGKGLYAPRAVADDGERHFYMGNFDFHVNNGLRVEDIGKPVREYIFNRLNRDKSESCHAVHVEQYKEVWFYVTVSGQDWPTEVWKYNYEIDMWYFDTCSAVTTANFFKRVGSRSWNQMAGTWNQQSTFWDDQQGAASAPIMVFGQTSGFSSQLDGSTVDDLGLAIEGRLETKDYSGLLHKGLERDTRWLQFDVWARGNSVKLYYSKDRGSTWVYVGEKDLTGTTEKVCFYFDVVAPHIRFRVVQDGSQKNLTVQSFQPYFLDAGEILK